MSELSNCCGALTHSLKLLKRKNNKRTRKKRFKKVNYWLNLLWVLNEKTFESQISRHQIKIVFIDSKPTLDFNHFENTKPIIRNHRQQERHQHQQERAIIAQQECTKSYQNQNFSIINHKLNDSAKIPNYGGYREWKKDQESWKEYSNEFLNSDEWCRVRYEAMLAQKKRTGLSYIFCECCGYTSQKNSYMHVDHIKPRYKYPQLQLDPNNLQILCKACNFGKGAYDETDWRETKNPSFEQGYEQGYDSGVWDGMVWNEPKWDEEITLNKIERVKNIGDIETIDDLRYFRMC